MQAKGLRSSEDGITEYCVVTTTGRIFSWSAFDYDDLFRSLQEKGHVAEYVRPMAEHMADMEQLKQEIQEERKTA